MPLTIDPGGEHRLNHTISRSGGSPGVTIEQAQAEMDAVASRVGRQPRRSRLGDPPRHVLPLVRAGAVAHRVRSCCRRSAACCSSPRRTSPTCCRAAASRRRRSRCGPRWRQPRPPDPADARREPVLSRSAVPRTPRCDVGDRRHRRDHAAEPPGAGHSRRLERPPLRARGNGGHRLVSSAWPRRGRHRRPI